MSQSEATTQQAERWSSRSTHKAQAGEGQHRGSSRVQQEADEPQMGKDRKQKAKLGQDYKEHKARARSTDKQEGKTQRQGKEHQVRLIRGQTVWAGPESVKQHKTHKEWTTK